MRAYGLNYKLYMVSGIILVLLLSFMSMFIYSTKTNAKSDRDNITYKSVLVESGDTINDIASEYLKDTYFTHTELVSEIMRVNFLSSDQIYAGAYIVVPVVME